MSEKCFDRCCRNASGSLTTSEKTCLSNCHDMYFKTIDVVADTLNHLNAQAQQKYHVSFNKDTQPRQTQPSAPICSLRFLPFMSIYVLSLLLRFRLSRSGPIP